MWYPKLELTNLRIDEQIITSLQVNGDHMRENIWLEPSVWLSNGLDNMQAERFRN